MLTFVLVLDGIVEVMVWAEPGTDDRETFPIPKYTSSAVEEYLHRQLLSPYAHISIQKYALCMRTTLYTVELVAVVAIIPKYTSSAVEEYLEHARPVSITVYIHCTLSRFKSTRNCFMHAHNTVYSRAICSSWLQGNTWYVG